MEYELKNICDTFLKNQEKIKENFKWTGSEIRTACSMLITNLNKNVNQTKLSESKQIFKENVGIFSKLSGNYKNQIITLMSISDHPKDKLTNIIELYKKIKEYFPSSDYLVLIATFISDIVKEEEYDTLLTNTKVIYDRMKKEHSVITSHEDVVMCLLFAFTSKNVDNVIKDTEECYNTLKSSFKDSNARQTLSHIITIKEGSLNDNCNKVIELSSLLKKNKIKYGTSFEIGLLGLLVSSDKDNKEIVENFIEVDNYLKQLKQYSKFKLSNAIRYIHVCNLLLNYYNVNDNSTNLVIYNLVTLSTLISQSVDAAIMMTVIY